MNPPEPGEVRIRNRRYRPWGVVVGVMLLVLFFATLFFPIVLDQRFDLPAKVAFLVVALAMAGYGLQACLLTLGTREHRLAGRRATARAVWNSVLLGILPADPVRARAAILLSLFGWMTPRRVSVASLTLGEWVAFAPRPDPGPHRRSDPVHPRTGRGLCGTESANVLLRRGRRVDNGYGVPPDPR